MSDHTYNEQVAFHYAAYRPALHEQILAEALTSQTMKTMKTGLDIGCGTGRSTIALAKYCNNIIGIDPSQDMLNRTTLDKSVRYLLGRGSDIPMPDKSVDVVTFAGVLSYTNNAQTIDELRRVCVPNALIIAYDFEILLDDIIAAVLPYFNPKISDYNHAENLEGERGVKTITSHSKQVEFVAGPKQAAHILLSDSKRFSALTKAFDSKDPFPQLVKRLVKLNLNNSLVAQLYYSVHRLL
ncbi:MAG: class I SAM-dependent methyltransferase [Rhizobiaceae bacterium]